MATIEFKQTTMSNVEISELMLNTTLTINQKINALQQANFSRPEINNLLFVYREKVIDKEPEIKIDSLTFGVELETLCRNRVSLEEIMRNKGIKIKYESYNHNDYKDNYKIVTDSSVYGSGDYIQSAEIVSPILKGRTGLLSLKQVCEVLQAETVVNKSCGLHVHIGAEKFTMKQWHNLYINIYRLESVIDSFMPASRHNNEYCKNFESSMFDNFESRIRQCNSTDDIRRIFCDIRSFKINACSYSRHKTIEFRQHAGTTDFEKIEMWVNFLRKLVIFSRGNLVEKNITINELPFLNNAEKAFFTSRANKFNHSMQLV